MGLGPRSGDVSQEKRTAARVGSCVPCLMAGSPGALIGIPALWEEKTKCNLYDSRVQLPGLVGCLSRGAANQCEAARLLSLWLTAEDKVVLILSQTSLCLGQQVHVFSPWVPPY